MKACSYQPHFFLLQRMFEFHFQFFFSSSYFLEPQEREVQYQYYMYDQPTYYYDPPAYGPGPELDCSCKRDCGYDEFENGDCANDQTRCCKFES